MLPALYGGVLRPDYTIQRLTPKQIGKDLMTGLVRTGMESFGKGMTIREITDHVLSCDLMFVALGPDGVVIGFGGSKYLGKGVNLAGAAVTGEGQGNGIYKALTRARIEQGLASGCSLITTRTQNPRVESGIMDVMEELKISGTLFSYSLSRKLVPAVYGRMLTDSVPRSTREDINLIYKSLNYDAGDAYVLEFGIVGCVMHDGA